MTPGFVVRVAAAAALLGAASPAHRLSAQTASIDSLVESARTAFHVPGVGLAVIKGDSIVLARGYGTRATGQDAPVDARTIFAIGSASKAFTAAGLAILADAGKLAWDDPVTKHLPEFEMYDAYASKEMRLRDLVTHRSGLQRGDLLWYGTSLTREEIVRRVRFLKPTWSLRTTFGYQNLMYLTAGQVSARLEGKPWDDVIRDRFFGPLEMPTASTTIRALAGRENLASPHSRSNDTTRVIPWRNIDNIAPAGSINASALEMANWVRMWLNKGRFNGRQILSESQVAEATRPQFVINDPLWQVLFGDVGSFLTYGFGWIVQDYQGHKLVSHGGNIDGMSALIAFVPGANVGVVILTNLNGTLATKAILMGVLDRMLGLTARDWVGDTRRLTDMLEAQGRMAQKRREDARARDTRPSLALSGYTGTFSDSLYGDITVREEGGRLVFGVGLRPDTRAPLEHWHHDSFQGNWTDPTLGRTMVTFQFDADGKVKAVDVEGLATFVKVPERTR